MFLFNRPMTVLTITMSMIAACSPSADKGSPDSGAGSSEGSPVAPVPSPRKVDLNDVSILLSPPARPEDPVIAITDLRVAGGPVWPDEAFGDFLAIAGSEAGAVAVDDVANHDELARINVEALSNKADWQIASIRIDPGAPGLSPEIASAFGQSPEIRLVLQPLVDGDVLDVAAHLIFSYASGVEQVPGCPLPRIVPDKERFQAIVDDVLDLKVRLAEGRIGDQPVVTDGKLGIHPASDPEKASAATRAAFRDALLTFLERHLDPSRLRAMSLMGLPRRVPEPWIFLSMTRDPKNGGFVPLPNPTLEQDDRLRFAQMFDVRPGTEPRNPSVSPVPMPNNLNPIACEFEVPPDPDNDSAPTSPASPLGVSTAALFPDGSAARMREIVAVVADPQQAHFFNTDCVSCHTETRREMDILGTDSVDAPVDPAVLPKELWDLRNFGWFPPSLVNPELGLRATATRRTAVETQEVVDAINANFLTPARPVR